jgi:hypothetical protein
VGKRVAVIRPAISAERMPPLVPVTANATEDIGPTTAAVAKSSFGAYEPSEARVAGGDTDGLG